jgi:hypothetical protein
MKSNPSRLEGGCEPGGFVVCDSLRSYSCGGLSSSFEQSIDEVAEDLERYIE